MKISEREIELVKKSWFAVATYKTAIVEDFYIELFRRHPQYETLFRTDQRIRHEKLASMLNIIVNGLDVWESLKPEIERLGRFHANISIFEKNDYDNLIKTLIWAMARYQGISDCENNEISMAWYRVFDVIAETMRLAPAIKEEVMDDG